MTSSNVATVLKNLWIGWILKSSLLAFLKHHLQVFARLHGSRVDKKHLAVLMCHFNKFLRIVLVDTDDKTLISGLNLPAEACLEFLHLS